MLPPIWYPRRVTAVETGGTQITFRNGERTALAGIRSIKDKDAQFSQPCSFPDLHSSQSCPECLGGLNDNSRSHRIIWIFFYFLVLTYLLLLSSFFCKGHGNNSVPKIGRGGFVTKEITPQMGNRGIGHQISNFQHHNPKRREKFWHIEVFCLLKPLTISPVLEWDRAFYLPTK